VGQLNQKMNSAKAIRSLGYEVIRYLGSGAGSTIWQVQDRRTYQVYALKCVEKRRVSEGRFIEQALNEGEVGMFFNHPTIRRIYQVRRVRRWLSLKEAHLVMEYCEGQTVQESRPESIGETLRIFSRVANALWHMNSKGYVHADMKPNNIIVAPDGTVKIIDFGQSCTIGTIKARIQGTPDFIAPEQVYRRPLDGRTDVFNFGASLYWTLTGKPIPTVLPRQGSITVPAAPRIDPVESLNPDVPPALGRLVADLIEIDPMRRPSSMNEVMSRLSLISYKLAKDNDGAHAPGNT